MFHDSLFPTNCQSRTSPFGCCSDKNGKVDSVRRANAAVFSLGGRWLCCRVKKSSSLPEIITLRAVSEFWETTGRGRNCRLFSTFFPAAWWGLSLSLRNWVIRRSPRWFMLCVHVHTDTHAPIGRVNKYRQPQRKLGVAAHTPPIFSPQFPSQFSSFEYFNESIKIVKKISSFNNFIEGRWRVSGTCGGNRMKEDAKDNKVWCDLHWRLVEWHGERTRKQVISGSQTKKMLWLSAYQSPWRPGWSSITHTHTHTHTPTLAF